MFIAVAIQKDPIAVQTVNANVQACTSRDVAMAVAELFADLDQKKRKVTIDPQNFKRFLVSVIPGEVISAENRIDPTKR